jgi:hypothetical protein
LVLQDISRRALTSGFAREQEDARGAERRYDEDSATVPSKRMIQYGLATDFLASSSGHNGLSSAATARLEYNQTITFSMTGPRGSQRSPQKWVAETPKRFNNDDGITNSIKVSVTDL